MQTILGATGQIGRELALSLKRDHTSSIRLVSRYPEKINDSDKLVSADLMDASQTLEAVGGSEIVYMTAGLPLDSQLWTDRWPVMMRNVIDACAAHGAKLVYFDNTYMYSQTSEPQLEDAPFRPNGPKGRVRAEITRMLLDAMDREHIEAVICRAPEFYGPGRTQSITNSTVIDNLLAGKPAKVFLRDDTLRTLIFTPDASRAMALLGNTPDAYGQTWHLPCDDNRLTYRQFVELAAGIFGVDASYKVLKRWQIWLAARANKTIRETEELLPRYKTDNLFISEKFKSRFPDFRVTTYREGLTRIRDEHATR
ncbi:NAD-dependent epimerase/dehydratase family protein [Marinobacter sp. M216]|uniref:NAD-dependent epimerase/dehydratase family protein n=1 Tax=Marinobacter albus TaxID=3030833 RepID=A0ABT7HEJ1_9GAMM|nr:MULTISPECIES: NAD-dependent epimerase/dehydratase family protein [unclassified Marinobacter]MBW7469821.1 NAD-dependent epimerase/dehydratase family protein [Marinobacter sp. F4218]MDK9557920.1 NAD-dependent epimerase/dehydratase family protein [Marinobacter sp. M216]